LPPALTEPGQKRALHINRRCRVGYRRIPGRLRKRRNQPSSSSDPEASSATSPRSSATALMRRRQGACLQSDSVTADGPRLVNCRFAHCGAEVTETASAGLVDFVPSGTHGSDGPFVMAKQKSSADAACRGLVSPRDSPPGQPGSTRCRVRIARGHRENHRTRRLRDRLPTRRRPWARIAVRAVVDRL
jgi:hypothetical protein